LRTRQPQQHCAKRKKQSFGGSLLDILWSTNFWSGELNHIE
jgi:hypothetical protein